MTIEAPDYQAPPPEPVDVEQEGLLETALSVVTEPVPTLRRVTAEANLGWAFLLTAVIGALTSVATAAQLQAAPQLAPPGSPGLPELGAPAAFAGALIGGPIAAIVALAIGAGILHLVALMLRGKGRYRGLFCGLAFASVPNLLQIPFQLAGAALGTSVQAVTGFINFGISVWVVVLAVIAVRENNPGFSTGRAVVVVILPLAVVLAIVFFIVIAIAALLIGGAGGAFIG